MFLKQSDVTLSDLSTDLRDEDDWKLRQLRVLDFPLNISCFAIEPVARLLAIGTSSGTVHIFGRAGVQCKLTLPNTSGARLLEFSLSTYHLLCIDNENQLHVYDLLEIGRPKLAASARFDQVNSMTVSPSHSHVFLAVHHGDIKTYDLGCLRKSSYTMPNMWKLYEETQASQGIPTLAAPIPCHPVDTVLHPRNLNLVFVAYSGGVILTDLAERSTVRSYEHILIPGAPGGAGYGLGDILTHRKLEVTCMAIHPSGHFFAVGYADGSIAFWAVENDKCPILVRTLDCEDVDTVDEALLELHLGEDGKEKPPQVVREPIFKLSWSSYTNSSDPRGGQTTLTILGGVNSNKPPGLTVLLLPPFNPAEPPAASGAKQPASLHPLFQQAMRDSLDSLKCFYYETSGIIQDYLLIPRSSPHWAGTHDPYTVLMIIEMENTRTVEAFQFPPPGFVKSAQLPTSPLSASSEDDYYYEDTFSPKAATGPKSPVHTPSMPTRVETPLSLLLGNGGLLGGSLLKLENQIYHDFIDRTISSDVTLGLKGGQVYPNKAKLNELKLSKHHPHRILVTYDADLTVRFFDVSPQLFIPPPGPSLSLESEWPKPLTGLTIQVNDLLDDTSILDCLLAPADRLAISSVHMAPEALECAIVMESGEVLVYHSRNSSPPDPSKSMSDTEILLLNQSRSRPESRLIPFFMLVAGKGPVEACAISDIGFLAVSYKDGTLMMVDLRGPRLMLSHHPSKMPRSPSITKRLSTASIASASDVIQSLKWTVSSLDKDPKIAIRLLCNCSSDEMLIFTISHSGSPPVWSVTGEPLNCKGIANPLQDGLFVIDSKTGEPIRSDRSQLAAAYRNVQASGVKGANPLLLSVGARGMRTAVSINGDKIAKVDWSPRYGDIEGAQIVERLGSHALVIQTDRNELYTYSLPHLEHMHTMKLEEPSPLPLSMDETGDYICWISDPHIQGRRRISTAIYGTFFDFRRVYDELDVDFACTRGTIPAQPQPVSLGPASIIGSFFTFNQTLSGAQIDELLGGPNRPVLQRKVIDRNAQASEEVEAQSGGSNAAGGIVAGAAGLQAGLYDRLTSALSERGQMLGDLEERFNSLQEGSKDMVAQAKRLAAQQSAKSWFGF